VTLHQGIYWYSYFVYFETLLTNLLQLSRDRTARISDFGMSRILSASEGKTKTSVGPIKWMAPESFKQIYSEKSDVWSYGIIVSEIVTRHEPFEGLDNFDAATQIRDEYLTPTIDESNCPPILMKIMIMCWKGPPENRPTLDVICTEFDNQAKE